MLCKVNTFFWIIGTNCPDNFKSLLKFLLFYVNSSHCLGIEVAVLLFFVALFSRGQIAGLGKVAPDGTDGKLFVRGNGLNCFARVTWFASLIGLTGFTIFADFCQWGIYGAPLSGELLLVARLVDGGGGSFLLFAPTSRGFGDAL